MRHRASEAIQPRNGAILLLIAALALLAPAAQANRKTSARAQFVRAVKLRTELEGKPQKDRELAEYKQAVAAFDKVYKISSQAEEVTPSLIAEGELYREMGALFDERYYSSAVRTYQFLLKQYPTSRYRSEAIFSIGQIQKENLLQPEAAEATFKEFLKRFPRSARAEEARESLKEIAEDRERQQEAMEAAKNQPPPQESEDGTPHVTDIRTWNAENYTRIVVTLDDSVKYDSSRIPSPDRIYFDLYQAKLAPGLLGKTLKIDDGLLKSVRVAQNKQGVVRLVLDVDSIQDYSAFLLTNPYRLVIDVHGRTETAANTQPEDTTPTTNEAARPAPKPTETVAASPERQRTPAVSPKPATTKTLSSRGKSSPTTMPLQPPTVPKPTRDGQRSLTRTLGLKIGRIVIDPGHGGHDTGTIGPHGLTEKDLCLDVALRLGRLIEERLPGAEVVYTRKDDAYVPLEERTAIANQAQADLFISIHANSSHNRGARGVETYYLNFATSQDTLEVATRENALSQQSLHDLQDLIKKIARNEKIEESKELAIDIQDSLSQRLRLASHGEKSRGVKKAPFIVLIGANMPSVLSEISFISNPNDERLLRKPDQRQRIAEGLYRGITTYLDNLNSLSYNRQRLASDGIDRSNKLASDGNPK